MSITLSKCLISTVSYGILRQLLPLSSRLGDDEHQVYSLVYSLQL